MKKPISAFISRTIFSLVKNYRISILIGYTVFPTSEEKVIVILLMPPCWGRRERINWLLCQKQESFSSEKYDTEIRTALAHDLDTI